MNFPTLISRQGPFPIIGMLGGIFIFIQTLKETSVSMQWKTRSDAVFCSVWSSFALFADVPQK